MLFNEVRVKAWYDYQVEETEVKDRLEMPPEVTNPIVQKFLHELRALQ